jgi:hypothetical protein
VWRATENDLPGSTNMFYPFVHTPLIKAELNLKPMLIRRVGGSFQPQGRSARADLLADLGWERRSFLIEWSARLQIARFSARFNAYDAPNSFNSGANAHLRWPEFRLGLEADLVQRGGMRFGLDVDFYPQRPVFTWNLPDGFSGVISPSRPLTVGVHYAYRVCEKKVGTSFEIRYRHPLTRDTKIYEVEAAAGLLLPETVLGNSSFRLGIRYSSLQIERSAVKLDTGLLGLYGEFVFFYH